MRRLRIIALIYVGYLLVLWLAGFGALVIVQQAFGDGAGVGFGFRWPEALLSAASAATCNGLLLREFAVISPLGQWVLLTVTQLGAMGAIVATTAAVEAAWPASREQGRAVKPLGGVGLLVIAVCYLVVLQGALFGTLVLMGQAWQPALFSALSAGGQVGWDTGDSSGTPFGLVIAFAAWLGGLGVLICRHRLVRRRVVVVASWALLLCVVGVGVAEIAPHISNATTANQSAPVPVTGQILLDKLILAVQSAAVGPSNVPWWAAEVTRPASQVIELASMIVGGAPGSAAGGVVLPALVLLVIGRVRAALLYLGVMTGLIFVGFWSMAVSEAEGQFAWGLLRPVVGAVTGGGAGRSEIGDMYPWNRATIIALMLLGRVGLVICLAIGVRRVQTTRQASGAVRR